MATKKKSTNYLKKYFKKMLGDRLSDVKAGKKKTAGFVKGPTFKNLGKGGCGSSKKY